jgi:hypothetical protein
VVSGVGGQDAESARVAQDAQAGTSWYRLLGQQGRGVDKIVEVLGRGDPRGTVESL